MEKKIKVEYEKEKCIVCGSCVAIAPKNWEYYEDKVRPIKEEISDEEFEENMEAAEACPVNCIHIHKDGKKLI